MAVGRPLPHVHHRLLERRRKPKRWTPQLWAKDLNALVEIDPEYAVAATSAADVGSRGFERIMSAVDRLQAPASRALRVFAYGAGTAS